jgi:hypothetical protein
MSGTQRREPLEFCGKWAAEFIPGPAEIPSRPQSTELSGLPEGLRRKAGYPDRKCG